MKNKSIIFYLVIVILTLILIVMGYMIKNSKNFGNKDADSNFKEQIAEENTDNSNDLELNSEMTNEEKDVSSDYDITVEQQNELLQEQTTDNITELSNQDAVGSNGLKLNPSVGDMYANLVINKIEINAPIFLGNSDEIILNGVGHNTDSYFPGEDGTVIMCEHSYLNNFNRLQELENGDTIEINTGYGNFSYVVVDKQIIHETEMYNKMPITKEKEQLMIYTDYEMPNEIERTQYKIVIYADKV